MNTFSYDKKIEHLQNLVDNKEKEMDKIYNQFIDATIINSKIWSKKTIEEHVKINYQITLSRKDNTLKTLKKECANLIEQMPDIVEKNLNRDGYWIHNQSIASLNKFFLKITIMLTV